MKYTSSPIPIFEICYRICYVICFLPSLIHHFCWYWPNTNTGYWISGISKWYFTFKSFSTFNWRKRSFKHSLKTWVVSSEATVSQFTKFCSLLSLELICQSFRKVLCKRKVVRKRKRKISARFTKVSGSRYGHKCMQTAVLLFKPADKPLNVRQECIQ